MFRVTMIFNQLAVALPFQIPLKHRVRAVNYRTYIINITYCSIFFYREKVKKVCFENSWRNVTFHLTWACLFEIEVIKRAL